MKYKNLSDFMDYVRARDPNQPEFLQAVQEVMGSLWGFIAANPQYAEPGLLERLVEPERAIQFRVAWVDDRGDTQVNRAFRIQHSSAIGPFKGGMRFHPSVNLSILKFLAFEQTFKNALTTLPMGGGKGGSDFDPKGKSRGEVMRFCQALMVELYRHLGPDTDVPAGDIGVGGREVDFMAGMRVSVSGSGNVSQYTIEKVLELGGKVVTCSDSGGTVIDEKGFTREKLDALMDIKNNQYGRVSEYAKRFDLQFVPGVKPWGVPVDIALPSATQNEIDGNDARELVKNGVKCVAEGANMPSTLEAVDVFLGARILYAPGKASNAGGVATSGLEMTQNAQRLPWSREQVDAQLHRIMQDIHANCVRYGEKDGFVNYVDGANIAGFVKVADAMMSQGTY